MQKFSGSFANYWLIIKWNRWLLSRLRSVFSLACHRIFRNVLMKANGPFFCFLGLFFFYGSIQKLGCFEGSFESKTTVLKRSVLIRGFWLIIPVNKTWMPFCLFVFKIYIYLKARMFGVFFKYIFIRSQNALCFTFGAYHGGRCGLTVKCAVKSSFLGFAVSQKISVAKTASRRKYE